MIPFYKIVVNEDDETGVDFNSFVDAPAHMKSFIAFDGKERFQINEEKRMVTGVFISVGTPIYRNSPDIGEHYVVFDADTVDIIKKKFFKNGFNKNVNKMHDPNQVVKAGVTLLESYTVSNSDPRYPNIPEAFEHMDLKDGSWIGTYYVEDDALWNDVKSGKFNGFSVEGWFDKKKVNVKQTKMSKQENKSIWQMLFGSDTPQDTPEAKTENFATATTADGMEVSYEGELGEGTMLSVVVDGETLPAPEGEHQLTLEDGSVKIVMVNAEGAVTQVADFTENAEDTPSSDEEMKKEVAEVMSKVLKDTNERFEAIESELKSTKEELETTKKENATLKAKFEAVAEGDKFKANPKKTEEVKPNSGYKELLKRK